MLKRKPIPRELKKELKKLYGKKCAHCDGWEHVQIHHIDRDPGNNVLENLVPLCIWCHIAEHPHNATHMIEWVIRKDEKKKERKWKY